MIVFCKALELRALFLSLSLSDILYLTKGKTKTKGACPLVAMCRTSITVRISTQRRRHYRSSARRSNPSNLCHPSPSTYTDLEVMGGLWNCQSAAKKANSISAYASLMTFHFPSLQTWITPENSATPAALSTTPKPSGRGGGTGLLISPKWSYQVLLLEHLARSAFELHTVTVTLPIKLFSVVIYHPPRPPRDFYDEMDALLSCFPEDGKWSSFI